MSYKEFDKELHRQNDSKAKKAGITFWTSRGYKAIENPDEYGPDLIIEKETPISLKFKGSNIKHHIDSTIYNTLLETGLLWELYPDAPETFPSIKKTFYVEVEIKHSWVGDHFPFSDLHIPERKKKFAESGLKTYFMVFNHDLTHFLMCPDSAVINAPLKNVSNICMIQERFFKVPRKHFIQQKM